MVEPQDDDGASGRDADEPTATWRAVVTDLYAIDRAVVDDVVAGTELLGVHVKLLIELSRLPEGRSPMNMLAASIRVSVSSLTTLVDRLSDLGFARRDASQHDRRVIYVVLTPPGMEEAIRLRTRYVRVLRSRVLATVTGGTAELADIARRLA